jgi:hypothetical protein
MAHNKGINITCKMSLHKRADAPADAHADAPAHAPADAPADASDIAF